MTGRLKTTTAGPVARRALAALVVTAGFVVASIAAGPAMAGTTTKTKITANWQKFFAGTTAASNKIQLLENGTKFTAIIDAQAKSSLAKSTTAKVSSVTSITNTSAKVRYSIDLGGQPALTNQTGTAVYQAGTWKVGTASFCALLALEGTKSSACPKA